MLLVPDMGQFADGVHDYTVLDIIILDNVAEWVKPDIFRGKLLRRKCTDSNG